MAGRGCARRVHELPPSHDCHHDGMLFSNTANVILVAVRLVLHGAAAVAAMVQVRKCLWLHRATRTDQVGWQVPRFASCPQRCDSGQPHDVQAGL